MNGTGTMIKQLRIEAGYTQRALADALHVTDKAVSKWERGICLPDVTLLPRMSLLLDADVDLLIARNIQEDGWVGLIDIPDCDFSQIVYDKPMAYYFLSHFLLLGIRKIHIQTSEENRCFLSNDCFTRYGFDFSFDRPKEKNIMALLRPWFLFGSDLTHQFQGAMSVGKSIKLKPENQKPVFFFCRSEEINAFFEERNLFIRNASSRTLGRGMLCFNMDDQDRILDVASFIKTYQKNSGLLIGSLEEIAFRKGIISNVELKDVCSQVAYGDLLRRIM